MKPEEWQQRRLGEVARIVMGGTPDRNRLEYWGGNIPWIKTTSIRFNTILNGDEFITEEGLRNSSASILPRNAILMAMYGQGVTRGRVAVLGIEAATNQACAAILVEPCVDHRYLFYFLWNQYRQIRKLSHGSNQKNLNTSLIKGVPILLPPLPEQRKIAAILGTWDEAIALTERRISAGQRRKLGLMQRLLSGQVRFREFVQSTGIRRTELGTYPQDWPVQRLSDVATVRLSNVDKKMAPGERVVRLCNYTNVFRKDYIDNRSVFMSGSATESEVEKFSLKKEDVLLTKDSETREEIAEVAVVAIDAKDLVCGYHLAILRPNSTVISGFFLKEALRSGNVHNQFVRSANGITRYGLTLSVIENALIPVPPAAEQNRIVEVLAACDRELDLLARKRDALQRQKRGLMQQLLTGRVRVKV